MLITIPNLSEGRRPATIAALVEAARPRGGRVLDTHTDPAHNRTVITVAGGGGELAEAMTELARVARREIDLREHAGVHPRLGALDVCPFVPYGGPMADAVEAARMTARAIGELGLPVFLYGEAATRAEARELPDLRHYGIEGIQELGPDFGPSHGDLRTGVVCVGAREPLIAFNVWLACELGIARRIAAQVRERNGGLPGVRALGLPIEPNVSQVSMNLTLPDATGIETAFARVAELARRAGATVTAAEIVGLVHERHLPSPQSETARLLLQPGRSFESAVELS